MAALVLAGIRSIFEKQLKGCDLCLWGWANRIWKDVIGLKDVIQSQLLLLL